jgi:hypothetical protein
MGLDAHVRCNCAKEGKTKPFPFPGRLRFDECGEPFLADSTGNESQDLEELLRFDEWQWHQGCEHRGFLAEVRIGNISYVGAIRAWIRSEETLTGQRFPVLLEKVVYSGFHGGDCLRGPDVQALERELGVLESMREGELHHEFHRSMKLLCEASLASGNPIVF